VSAYNKNSNFKSGVKSQIDITNRAKSHGHFYPYVQNLTLLGDDDEVEVNLFFV
jgi:hypothetical protein